MVAYTTPLTEFKMSDGICRRLRIMVAIDRSVNGQREPSVIGRQLAAGQSEGGDDCAEEAVECGSDTLVPLVLHATWERCQ